MRWKPPNARTLLGLLVVVGKRVDGALQIAEELRHGLDPLVAHARGRKEALGLLEIAGLHGAVYKLRGRRVPPGHTLAAVMGIDSLFSHIRPAGLRCF